MRNLYDDIDYMRNHINYLATGNPLFLWSCYSSARKAGGAIPEQFLGYLDNVAQMILGDVVQAPPKRRPEALMAAMGLSKNGIGRGSPFAEYQERLGNVAIMMAVDTLKRIQEWGDGGDDYVFDQIAEEYHTSKSTVRRHYMALQHAISDLEESE